jgi:hypothetical protein
LFADRQSAQTLETARILRTAQRHRQDLLVFRGGTIRASRAPMNAASVSDEMILSAGQSELEQLRAEVRARFAELRGRFEEVDSRLKDVDVRFERVEAKIVAEGQKTHRHFDIMVEKLHASVRHVAARVQKIERR